MNDMQVSIGQVKRDISDLVNKVAYAGDRIILTSRGRPKAALVSMEDYETIKAGEKEWRKAKRKAWLAENRQLSRQILTERNGEPIDVDALWEEVRAEREARHDFLLDD